MFSRNRNPNYLGEALLYLSFAIVTEIYISYMILIFIWLVVFLPNMLVKDFRLAKKDGFNEYKYKSGLFYFWIR